MTSANAGISSLGYIGFRVADPEAWASYATKILGLMEAPPTDTARRFRLDQQIWRIAVEEGPEDDIAFIGLEVAGEQALAEIEARLASHGIASSRADDALLAERGVLGLVQTSDPMGLAVEIYYGPGEVYEIPFVSPAGVTGFVTGEQGVGHVVLSASDMEAVEAFYRDGLGFRLSDIITMALGPDFAIDLKFFHCNGRHHTVALVPMPEGKRLHHFMLEARTLDDVGLALDRLGKAGNPPLVQSLGRHTNDHMVSFYAATPAGFQVEYGWGARAVDEAEWRVVRHSRTSIWGHHFEHQA
jgi:2,3-dihydroxybiphenyl 1,2-dioxygenase